MERETVNKLDMEETLKPLLVALFDSSSSGVGSAICRTLVLKC